MSGFILKCEDCSSVLPLKVCRSNAGYYVGRFCNNCGPYDRYSGYYDTAEEAEKALPAIQAEESPVEGPALSLAGDW